MATLYDFPTNTEAKLKEADELIEKNYMDQAICLLEDYLECFKDKRAAREVYKKLLSCYLLIKEFEACDTIILQLNALNCLDLTIAAHDIIVSLFQDREKEGRKKQEFYRQHLGLTTLTYKNLLELVFQLKTTYEEYWLEGAAKAFDTLLLAQDFEGFTRALVQLQTIEAAYFIYYKDKFLKFFTLPASPILKTMGFELGIQKGIELQILFTDDGTQEEKLATKKELEELYRMIEEVRTRLQHGPLDAMEAQLIEQQIVMFYQWVFPFVDQIEVDSVLEYFLSPDQIRGEQTPVVKKIGQYLLSFSSLV